jgi:hypothetical protein
MQQIIKVELKIRSSGDAYHQVTAVVIIMTITTHFREATIVEGGPALARSAAISGIGQMKAGTRDHWVHQTPVTAVMTTRASVAKSNFIPKYVKKNVKTVSNYMNSNSTGTLYVKSALKRKHYCGIKTREISLL